MSKTQVIFNLTLPKLFLTRQISFLLLSPTFLVLHKRLFFYTIYIYIYISYGRGIDSKKKKKTMYKVYKQLFIYQTFNNLCSTDGLGEMVGHRQSKHVFQDQGNL